jgi:uncharacterized protein with GYD domain
MAKYLIKGSFTAEGLKQAQKIKAGGLRTTAMKVAEALGGKLEAYYFAFGQDDVIGIGDLPDNASVAAISVAVNSAGLVKFTVTPLMTVEEMDKALNKAAALPVLGR